MRVTKSALYFSDVRLKMDLAHRLFAFHGGAFAVREEVRQVKARLRDRARLLSDQMAIIGLFTLCTDCAGRPGGGCCSMEMANETDAVLLFMNLLLGQDVAFQRDDGFECFFLGVSGCTLLVKPIFCLNYNCHWILTGNSALDLHKLGRATAALHQEQLLLEDLANRFIAGARPGV